MEGKTDEGISEGRKDGRMEKQIWFDRMTD